VALLDANDEAVRGVLTDSDGSFRIEAPFTGQYRLRAARIGFQTTTSPPFDVDIEKPLEVELRMATEAILLAPLTVISERMPLVLNARLARWGYYERKELYGDEGMGFAQFLERDEIERTIPFMISDVLRTIPGVRVRGEDIYMRLGCTPAIYLDGTRYRMSMAGINDIVSVSSVVAIEVYKGSVMPARYMHFSQAGGSLAAPLQYGPAFS